MAITKEKELRKREAQGFKAAAYKNLAALTLGEVLPLPEAREWWLAIHSCRSKEDAEGISHLFASMVQMYTPPTPLKVAEAAVARSK